MTLLRIRNATKSYNGVPVLKGVDLELEAGRLTGLIGENGAGKSTLIRILTGLTPLDGGEILVDGDPVAHWNAEAARAAGIAVIHQELQLVPELTVAQNMALGRPAPTRGMRRALGMRDDGAAASRATELLAQVGVTGLDARSRVAELSPTQAQLVLIARALRERSRILVMDEPTAALAANERGQLFALVRRLLERGTSVLLVSHHLHEVHELAHDVVALRNGVVSAHLTGDAITIPDMVRAMLNRELDSQFPERTPSPDGEVVLDAVVGHTRLPEQIPLQLRRGEILGVVGLLGAGKTELARALVGLDRSTGTVSVGGGAPFSPSPRAALAAGIVLVPEERKQQAVFGDLGVYENGVLSFVTDRASRAGLRRVLPHLSRIATQIRRVIDDVGVRFASFGQHAASLSGGNQQKLVLSRVLAASPAVLILDEPTRGVDVGSRRDIYEIVVAEARRGLGVIVCSSDEREVHGLAHRILVLQNGRVAHEIADPGAVADERLSILLNPTTATLDKEHVPS